MLQLLTWMLSFHNMTLGNFAGFHVARLLQLLSSYVRQEFDVLLADKQLNQLKVKTSANLSHFNASVPQ